MGTAVVQVALDVGLAAAAVALTGWADSVFVFLFPIAIVEGSLILFRRGAALAVALTLVAYLAVVLGLAPVVPPLRTVFVHAGAFLATGALAGYLSEQLRSAGERLAEREVDLARLSGLHEAIVQSLGSGLLTLDASGCVTFLNRAGEEMAGVSLAQAVGRPPTWFPPVSADVSRDERDLVNARGERLRLGFTAFPLRSVGGGEPGRAVIFQDLTHLRAMEERVERSERLADLGRVSAALAHELRNPLAAMTGAVELLRASAPSGSEAARLMEIVVREGGRLEELVSRLLDYARPSAPRRRDVDLAEITGEALDVFSHDPAAARIRLERSLAPAPAWCDPDQVRQVLWNLLINAARAQEAQEGMGRIAVATAAAAGGASLVVEDDGPGIPPQDLPHIFTPFFTTREGGSGLGLATVQRIVDAHQGTVEAESAPGRGARFTVRLPPPPEQR